jgi:hypothetical protein
LFLPLQGPPIVCQVTNPKWPLVGCRVPKVMPTSRRFPPPWSVEERQSCFIVKDGNGQTLAYVYFEEEPGRRAAENLMSHDEAGALAVNIAKLPELLCKKVD